MRRLSSVDQYKKALNRIEPTLHRNHRRLLEFHFRAHKHTITAGPLARMVEYRSSRGINLQYGLLGQKLLDALGWTGPAGSQSSYSIASFIKPDHDHLEWEWKMHGPLAEALRELRWV